MDLLADVLTISGVRGTNASLLEAGGVWGVAWAQDADAVVYVVKSGTAWLAVGGRPEVHLVPGDVVLLPTGSAHGLSGQPAGLKHACDAAQAATAQDRSGSMRLGTGQVEAEILAASYRHDPAMATQVLALLPEVVHVRAGGRGCSLDDTVRLLSRELGERQIAASVVLDRLVDVLLIQLLRAWLTSADEERRTSSWLNVLRDPLMTAALTRLHQDPARPWTTTVLAAELSVSRSTLARRFAQVTGETPNACLTRWRMDLAAKRLRDTDDSLQSIAESVGYTSVYAFSRAFSRERSQPPGRYRAASRSALVKTAA